MAHFSLSLLGAFQATLDGVFVTRFGSAKIQALLAYLAVEADRPHRRETLAGLLWPEQPDRTARNNLRQALSLLRKAVGDRDLGRGVLATPPVILVTREVVQFNCDSDCWVDIHDFQMQIAGTGEKGATVEELARAVALYHGDFLEGFYVSESAAFDDWALLVRGNLQRQASTALQRLTEEHAAREQYEEACTYAWRWVELEPWQEAAHQQLMTVLALSGRRTEALAQFEACDAMLQDAYGVEPSAGTLRLWQQIRDGSLSAAPAIERAAETAERVVPVRLTPFVGREHELGVLERHLAMALGGDGRVVLVTGEAGQGKTALIQAFAQRAQRSRQQLLVAGGNCSAWTGVGDPYLPFREILELLTGDITARETAASIDREGAQRLRRALPITARAVVESGPDLIDVFIPGAPLLRRAIAHATPDRVWVDELQTVVARQRAGRTSAVRQEDLFEQVARVLRAVARQAPLLLWIDDVQWVDPGSIGLLFHLGRRLGDSRILIVGAYRSEEVAAGRDDARHPLEPVLNEFRRVWGDVVIDLRGAESRSFVEALLDSEPNRLGDDFRTTLHRLTRGHALFTVELLRTMQERGDLIKDEEGRWVAGPRLDWAILPARVEAVVAERVGRLAEPLRAALRVASIEGEVFTAEAVAHVQGLDAVETVTLLSGELDRKHHLVQAEGVQRMAHRHLSQYRFRHILFQNYLYDSLDEVERVHLHERVGCALEGLYKVSADALDAAAPQLARHFERATMLDEAVHYYEMAGQRAIKMLAYEEAVAHLERGLQLLERLPASAERNAREMALRLAVATPTMILQSWGAPALVEHYRRIEGLAEGLGDVPGQLAVLNLVISYYMVRADHRSSVRTSERLLSLAQRLENPFHILAGHTRLSIAWMFLGEFQSGLAHLERLLPLYDRKQRDVAGQKFDADPKVGALSFAAYSCWYLGYPDRAVQATDEAVALAEDLDDPLSVFLAIGIKSRVHRWRREVPRVEALIEPLHRTWTEYHMPMGEAAALQDRGWALSERGHPEEGIPLYKQGLELWDATGMANHLSEFYGVLAEMHGKAGQPEVGLQLIEDAIAFMERTDERYHEAELYRLRGELLLLQDGDNAAQAAEDFHQAIEVAQRQSARMPELRAAMSLCCLWRDHGAKEYLAQALEHLAEVYAWFTEGFDTPDLQEARALLDESSAY